MDALVERNLGGLLLCFVFQLRTGHPADAGAAVVGLVLLDAAQAAQLLVARLSPLGNKQLVRVLLFHQPVVKVLRDGLSLVVQSIYVSRALMVDLENLPELLGGLGGELGGAVSLRISQLELEIRQSRLDFVEAVRGRLGSSCLDTRHGWLGLVCGCRQWSWIYMALLVDGVDEPFKFFSSKISSFRGER